MDTISSAEFRKRYAKLTEGTIVTVNGHPIGVWTPRHLSPDGVQVWPSETMLAESAPIKVGKVTQRPPLDLTGYGQTQAERDAILRRVNRGS